MLNRPPARSSHAIPIRGASVSAASSRVSLSSSSAASVTVPGVITRTTSRATGPLLVAGSPICSQIATDSPSFTSRARYVSAECTGTPAIGIGSPADCAALRERDVDELGGAARVVVEQLVEIAHPVEQQRVRKLRLDRKVLLHDRRMCGSIHAHLFWFVGEGSCGGGWAAQRS